MLAKLSYTAGVMYCAVVIIICGTFLKTWYDMNSWRIKCGVANIRSKIGL